MPSSSLPLQYLWTAVYKDGSKLAQTSEDRSSKDPDRSAFYDVDHEKLAYFYLTSESNIYLVDLENFRFEINGNIIEKTGGLELFNPRLIYFHRNTVSIMEGGLQTHEREFHLGFQANYHNEKGELRNYQEKMIIK